VGLEFELRVSCLQSRCITETTFPVHFSGYFGNRVSQTICPGWPRTAILQVSASQVLRITGVIQCPASITLLK
jgi:hypothetical protein